MMLTTLACFASTVFTRSCSFRHSLISFFRGIFSSVIPTQEFPKVLNILRAEMPPMCSGWSLLLPFRGGKTPCRCHGTSIYIARIQGIYPISELDICISFDISRDISTQQQRYFEQPKMGPAKHCSDRDAARMRRE